MLPYYLVFFVIFIIAACEETISQKRAIFLGLAAILIAFAGLRSSGVDLDYEGYRTWFQDSPILSEIVDGTEALSQRDPGFTLICSLFKSFGIPFESLIFFAAFVAIALKMRAIWLMSPMPLLSVFFYVPYLFLLQEMTQIRAGMAAAIFLCAIPSLVKKKYVSYVLLIILAACFHFSALIFIGFAFLRSPPKNSRVYFFALLLSVILAIFGFTLDFLFMRIASTGLDSRLSFYANAMAAGNEGATNLFNIVSLLNLLLSIILLIFYKKLSGINLYAAHIIRIQLISVITFFLLSGYPVMAFRLSELMGVVGMLAWPLVAFAPDINWGGKKVFLLLVGVALLMSTLRVMQDYSLLS